MKNDYVIERGKSINCNRTYNTIVAGFPGVGKSTAAEKYPDKYVDMESSDYHWIYTPDGERSVNPKWPNNYVDAIIKEATKLVDTFEGIKPQKIICISTHKEVLGILSTRGIQFDAVCPRTKDIYIQRYIDRGNNEAFVSLLQRKFEDFVSDLKDSDAHSIYFTDGYFSDIFNKDLLVHHFFDGLCFPDHYTNKMIVGVWPVGMASEIDIHNAIGFGYDDPNMAQYGNAETLIHHVRLQVIRPAENSIADFMKQHPNPDISKINVVKDMWERDLDMYYQYVITPASTDEYPTTKFVVMDMYPGIIDKLTRDSMNFILIVPSTYEKYVEYTNGSTECMTIEEFEDARRNLMSMSFHTIMTDRFIPMCLDTNALHYNDLEYTRWLCKSDLYRYPDTHQE